MPNFAWAQMPSKCSNTETTMALVEVDGEMETTTVQILKTFPRACISKTVRLFDVVYACSIRVPKLTSSSNSSHKADTSPSTESWPTNPVSLLSQLVPSSLIHASVTLPRSCQNLH